MEYALLGQERFNQLIVGIELHSFLLLTAIILCIGLYYNNRLKNAHIYALAARIPGPPTLPFIGNAHSFFGLDMTGAMDKFFDLKEMYGVPLRFWLGSELWVALMNPKDLEAVLTSEHAVNKNSVYAFFDSIASGLFTSTGDEWRTLRKLANPTFHTKLLERFVQDFNRQSEILVDILAAEVGRNEFDIKEYVSRCTLDMICGTQMGVKTCEQIENTSDFCNNLTGSVDIVQMRTIKLYLHPEFIFKLTTYYKKNQDLVKPLHRFTREVITQRKEALTNDSVKDESNVFDSESDKKRAIFLDTILEKFPDKNVDQLIDYVLDFIIGGTDTSAVAISYTLLMLAMHPEYQENVFKEQCEIFTNLESGITVADLNKMKYLEMAVKESLRLCSVPRITRLLTKDLKIENYTLPEGTVAFLSFFAVHRDKRYWKHPEKFYPDHFTSEELGKRSKYSFMPFSMGPRNCPGHKYGMLSVKTVLSHLIRRYTFTTTIKMEDLKYKISVMMEPVQGYFMSVNKR